MKVLDRLQRDILSRKAKIGIIGLGYVGLPLSLEFAKAGFQVSGFDTDLMRVRGVNEGKSYIPDVRGDVLKKAVKSKHLHASVDFQKLKNLQVIIICVPTPLRKTKEPDISHILSAVEMIVRNLSSGQLVILESTTYPGTTEEVILPAIEKTGLKVGRDMALAFSPERIDPGNKRFDTSNIPKVVGGVTKRCTNLTKVLYQQIVSKVIPVSSPKTAEMVKLLENTFRSVNIGLANELALMCNRLKVDVWEVIDAAATKPFGFMPFYPGPGLGGHCIPIDPVYLSWKAKLNGFEARFIDLASQVNSYMPEYVVDKLSDVLNKRGKALNGSRVLLVGVAYKKDVSDVRESPALEIIELLKEKGARVSYHDPYVPALKTESGKVRSMKMGKSMLKTQDAVIIVTNHSNIDYKFILSNSRLILDTRNALRSLSKGRCVVVKL